MRRALAFAVVLIMLAGPWPARANGGGPPEELLAHYTPSYDDTREQVTLDSGELSQSSADGRAEADIRGNIELNAWTGGLAVYGKTPPSARTSGAVVAPSFDWAGNQLRIEARFSYRLDVVEDETAEVQPFWNGDDWLRATVATGMEGDTPFQFQEYGWGATEGSASSVEILRDGSRMVSGLGVANSYVRAPCTGTKLSPYVQANLNVEAPGAGVYEGVRAARLRIYVFEMKVYRDTVTPCHRIADISVLDDRFEPRDVTVQRGQYVRFDYSEAQNYHEVIIPWYGSPYPGDPIWMYVLGTTTYYCAIHGTPDGQGMAGTITVT